MILNMAGSKTNELVDGDQNITFIIYSFILQILVEYLQCASHILGHKGTRRTKKPCLMELTFC